MIEVMVATLVISISVLGLAGMQISSKRVGHDAVQRGSATALALDLVERMRANPDGLTSYVTTGLGGSSITTEPTPNCTYDSSVSCSPAQQAAYDLWEWEQAIDGASETIVEGDEARAVGGLFNPTACVTVADGLVTISMAWEGYQAISNPSANTCGVGLGKYGSGDAKRQLVSLTTFVTRQ